jgi:mono/diheme cytochrome c family protein
MQNSTRIRRGAGVLLAGVVAGGVALAVSPAQAAEANAVRAGEKLAEQRCASCHAMTPRSPDAAPLAGPSFADIAKGSKSAPEVFRSFLLSTHSTVSHPGAMPRPLLTEEEIRLIFAYLASLRDEK